MTRHAASIVRATVVLTTAAAIAGCVTQKSTASDSASPDSTRATTAMTSSSPDTAWRSLIDSAGSAWRSYKQPTFPASWKVADGMLTKTGTADDLITKDEFGDFELAWDWKLGKAGNAGVFYRATEEYAKVYWSGSEYQLLDDAAHVDATNRRTAAGANYELYPSPAGVVKPANEWNSSRIVAKGPHVEHWMNGQKLLEYEMWSPDWEAKVKASKFKDWKNYGRAKSGHIAIQGDHEGTLAIRNVRIRELR